MGLRRIVLAAFFGMIGLSAVVPCTATAGLEAHEVLVVVNDSSAVSVAIGEYYRTLRSVPLENVLHLPAGTTTNETVSRSVYESEIRDPIETYLRTTAPHLEEQILCILTTKGVPLRISGPDRAAVDSALTQLFRGSQPTRLNNRYEGVFRDFRRFRADEGENNRLSYLVMRLTGYGTDIDPGTGVPADILALMDRSVAPPDPDGVFLLDQDPNSAAIGNQWMTEARDELQALGTTVVLNQTNTFISNQPDIVGYVSWGSNDCCDAGAPYWGEVPIGSGNVYPGEFLARSITSTYVSTNGRTFTDGNQNYGQSLVADLVKQGACAGGGHVYEPFLSAVPQPQFLFPAYVRGFSAAESYYNSLLSLNWMNTIVGDPLMRYRDYGPPSVVSVAPTEGLPFGGETVTVTGVDFREDPNILFGGIPSPSVTWVDLSTIQAVTPASTVFGPVDVTVRSMYGEDTLAGAFEYVFPPVTLRVSTTVPAIGDDLGITVTGPPAARYAVLADLRLGQTCVRGVCFSLAFTNKLTIVHDAVTGSDDPLGPIGESVLTLPIPNKPALVGRFVYFQGAVETGGGFEASQVGAILVGE